jgi:hypothetical protein
VRLSDTLFQRVLGVTMTSQRVLLCMLLFVSLIPAPATAATLEILPAAQVIQFGDVNIASEYGTAVFIVKASGSGSCAVSIKPDPAYAAPPGSQQISQPGGPLSNGESATIWVWITCTVPGDHEFHVKFESNCGDASRTLQFTCLGGFINGTVFDFFTKQPIPTAVVTPANPYTLHLTMVGNGAYSGAGNPESHWVWVRADGYREQLVNVTIEQAGTLTRDFELIPAPSLGDIIAAIQVVSGLELPNGYPYPADINGNGKMGLDDALLLLQLVSETR